MDLAAYNGTISELNYKTVYPNCFHLATVAVQNNFVIFMSGNIHTALGNDQISSGPFQQCSFDEMTHRVSNCELGDLS